MKNLILIISVLFVAIEAKSQCDKPYIPFKTFQEIPGLINDTITYLEYNFDNRQECFEGKTVADILEVLEMPVKAFTYVASTDPYLVALEVSISDYDYSQEKFLNPLQFQGLNIVLDDKILTCNLIELLKTYPNSKWETEHYDFFKDIKIKDVSNNHYKKIGVQSLWARDIFTSSEILRAKSDYLWHETMINSIPEIRKLMDNALKAPEGENIFHSFGLNIEKVKAEHLHIVPVEFFSLDSINWTFNTSVSEHLKPQKNKGIFLAMDRPRNFYVGIIPEFDGHNWINPEFKKIDTAMGRELYKINGTRNHPIYIVDVEKSPSTGISERYMVYTQNGNFRFIQPYGYTGFFIDELVSFIK